MRPSILLFLSVVSAARSRMSALTDCLTATQVPFVTSSSSTWASAVSPFNLRIPTPQPQVVATPRTVAEVQAAAGCASQANTTLAAKCGGHSYGAYGLAGGLVVDLAEFQEVSVDPQTQIATVGAGLRLGNLAIALYNKGQRAVPHGTCPGVGIGGHATIGGIGLSSRSWGLLADVILSVRVVTASGSLVTASATQNPDLFRAIRGGGAGFGIVVSFELKTFPAYPTNVDFTYVYSASRSQTGAKLYDVAQKWGLNSAPKEMGYSMQMYQDAVFLISGVYHGPRATFDGIIAPLLASLKSANGNRGPTETTVTVRNWLDALAYQGGGQLAVPVKGYDLHDTFYAKSIKTIGNTPLSMTALNGLFNYLYTEDPPQGTWWMVLVDLLGGPQSAITSLPANETSYGTRDSAYMLQFYVATDTGQPPWDPASVQYLNSMVAALGAETAGYPAYPGYADPELSATDARKKFWGAQMAQTLATVKATWDPKGILHNPQGF